MDKVYIYLYHNGMDVYLSDRKLSKEETYCKHCDEYDKLLEVCDSNEIQEVLDREYPEYDVLDLGFYGGSSDGQDEE